MRYVLGSRASIGGVLGSGRGGGGNGLLTGLVAYWGLDEASGNALDKHSGGLTLTQANNPGADTGKVYATARTFNGNNTYFSRASETAIQLGDIDFCVAAWVFLTNVTAQRLIASQYRFGDSHRVWFVDYLNTSNRFRFGISGDGVNATIAVADNFGGPSGSTWYLVYVYHDATANQIGISINNGTANTQAHTTGAAADTVAPLAIGAFFNTTGIAAGFAWQGRLGPVAMWKNRTLDATARAALYNGGVGLAYSAFTA